MNENSKRDKIRITADFHPEAYAVLNEVAYKLHTTKADALRRSLGLINFVLRSQEEGARFIMENNKGKERTLIKTI